MKIAFIIPMKHGMLSFNYNEIEQFEKAGDTPHIFPTRYAKGIYMPKKEWPIHVFSPSATAIMQPIYMTLFGSKYTERMKEAKRDSALTDFMIACNFSSVMQKENIDRIHCHFGDRKLFIGYYCSKLTGIPLSVTIHSHELYKNPNVRLFEKALEHASAVITISDYNRKYIEDNFSLVQPGKVQVVRLFIDTSKFSPAPAEPKRRKIKSILAVGQFTQRKGYDDLIGALGKLKDKTAELWIVGADSWDGAPIDVKKMAADAGVEKRVRFLGKVAEKDLIRLYRECTLFCLPSKTADDGVKEGIPVSLMEAMACGKTVVSTKHAGIPELVDSKYLVDEGDVAMLAMKLDALLANKSALAQAGQANRDIITTKYSSFNATKLIETIKSAGNK